MNTQTNMTGLDPNRLADWMDTKGLGSGPIADVTRLAGGTQNLIFRFRRLDRDYVLRRPSLAPRPRAGETMMREARVLAALAGSKVPHPALVAKCEDDSILGTAFYLMEPVTGFNAVNGMPEPHRSSPALRRRMGLALVEGAAALAHIDYAAAGLEGFGRPENFLERQVSRWRDQLDSYTRLTGWPGPQSLQDVGPLSDYLATNIPPGYRPGILHGDYQLANVMYRYDSPELAAIVDWELSTIGDPLLDLAWIVATWRGYDPELPVLQVEPWDGFPTADELIRHYADHSLRDMTCINWYVALACFKLGIILEGTHARACAGKAARETGDRLHEAAVSLVQRGLIWSKRPVWQ
ncbi:phosphotransferase family protein [uncultured Hyphomonas sp.]|uniref:phosphotransferase family protein n=1 Tax=uncultured Hyphomonas sp. TaxID=225298 RepID=UPI000C351803|nr:phosphotransferase family protein [Hyphomonadaceae bacterium]MBA29463.1 phosphotransferase family protein [Hyphomonadaceae bacterium]|tara:strand:+ start:12214 stop:13269 length:1056 start_codon:yes stop_codon:yes gene_type:complete